MLADPQPRRGIAEDHAVLLAVPEQGPDDADGMMTLVAGQPVDG
jgi:hypothetical protein